MTGTWLHSMAWTLGLLTMMGMAPGTWGQPTENHVLRAVPAPGAVTLDGDLGDWDCSGAIVLADDVEAPRYLARVSAMYDTSGVYLALEFKDPTPMINHVDPVKSPGGCWRGDAVQLRINCGPDGLEGPALDPLIHHVDCYWYTDGKQPAAYVALGNMAPGGVQGEPILQAIGKGVDAGFRVDADGKGYVQEIRLTWSLLRPIGQPLVAGQSFHLAIEAMWGDAQYKEQQADRITDLLNPKRPERAMIWTNPPAWGTVQLVERGGLEPDAAARPWPEWLKRYQPDRPQVVEDAPPPPDRPCLLDNAPASRLLNEWYAAKTAAGNLGDAYDNRDRGHSAIDTRQYPQLRKTHYTAKQKSQDQDWALSVGVWPFPTIGNSSTSAPPEKGGSNPRSAQVDPRADAALRAQYLHNNLYVYPEHQDYDPGINGRPGHGDLYPLNTPYVLISQGSSGSDRPFLDAVVRTMAAFQPQVKQKLVAWNLLMPTIQRIFRASNRQVAVPDDYFTGKAHPVVFQGDQIDEVKMVTMAHDMTLDTIPPLARVRVTKELPLTPSVDAPADALPAGEQLCNLPEVVGRVHRRWSRTLSLTVRATDSLDWQGKPLTYRWALLQGDPGRVTITPTADASEAQIAVAWHDRFAVPGNDRMTTNRVDIGLFVSNGQAWSAPAFICIYHPDNELRTYDGQGRLVDLFYAAGDTTIGYDADFPVIPTEAVAPYDIRDWSALIQLAATAGESPAHRLFRPTFDEAQRQALLAADRQVQDALAQYFANLKQSLGEVGPDAVLPTKPNRQAAEIMVKPLLETTPALNGSVKKVIEQALNAQKDDPTWYLRDRVALDEAAKALGPDTEKNLQQARQRLIALGIYQPLPDGGEGWELHSVRPGDQPVLQRLTRYERMEIQRFHLALITNVLFPGIVVRDYRVNYVDDRIVQPQPTWNLFTYGEDANAAPTVVQRQIDPPIKPAPQEEPEPPVDLRLPPDAQGGATRGATLRETYGRTTWW